MFASRASWRAAGFDVVERSNETKAMVARHARAPGLLFKKYGPAVSSSDERENFERRVHGARKLRQFITERRLRHVTVPRKQILALPWGDQLLAVERLDLRSVEQSEEAYGEICPAALSELCLVLFHFRGLDSIVDNVPFTTGGQLAFVDTENWARGRSRFFRYIRRHLSRESRAAAKSLFREFAIQSGGSVPAEIVDEPSSSWSSS